MLSMTESLKDASERAKATIQTTWQKISRDYTLGWAGPASVVAAEFPFLREELLKLGDSITEEMPLLFFRTRESPPKDMVTTIAYRNSTGSPFNCRIVSSADIKVAVVDRLSAFSQALWFAVARRMLPDPTLARAFSRALVAWTGSRLVALDE